MAPELDLLGQQGFAGLPIFLAFIRDVDPAFPRQLDGGRERACIHPRNPPSSEF
jgi:hypothetical protein